jgi:hypothetical protein
VEATWAPFAAKECKFAKLDEILVIIMHAVCFHYGVVSIVVADDGLVQRANEE